jgi:hypothetical protein
MRSTEMGEVSVISLSLECDIGERRELGVRKVKGEVKTHTIPIPQILDIHSDFLYIA